LETSGGLLNFFKDALLSTIGFETKDSEKPRIEGTATGVGGVAYSNYVGAHGGGRAGLLRLGTAKTASAIFESTWVTNPDQASTNGGFLANLGKTLVNKLKAMIPSTNPLGAFGGSTADTWQYRPEYKTGKDGAYYAFLADNSTFLKTPQSSIALFYNDEPNIQFDGLVKNYHKYSPQRQDKFETRVWYADDVKISDDAVGVADSNGDKNNLKVLMTRMTDSIDSFKNEANQFRRSAERYSEIKDIDGNVYIPYKDIPDKTNLNNGKDTFETGMIQTAGVATLDKRMFAKVSTYGDNSIANASDEYNTFDILSGKRGEEPEELKGDDENQSRDLIFFYFYDLINEKYIPFRATIKSVSDQHTADWEEISYIGRADKLFMYKGFSRDVSFTFTVYANSAYEMLPMWERINYLVGLTRPSKYTAVGSANLSQEEAEFNRYLNEEAGTDFQTSTGREGKFMYPPMTTFRLGDMYVDQPCILSSVGVNVSDEANWETLREDNYYYVSGPDKTITLDGVKSRQLPLQVDVSINMKILEKALSLGSNAHFGKTKYNTAGNQTDKWVL
jgi:hypothetical protein